MRSEEEIKENISIKQGVIKSVYALGVLNSIGEEVINISNAQIKALEWVLDSSK